MNKCSDRSNAAPQFTFMFTGKCARSFEGTQKLNTFNVSYYKKVVWGGVSCLTLEISDYYGRTYLFVRKYEIPLNLLGVGMKIAE